MLDSKSTGTMMHGGTLRRKGTRLRTVRLGISSSARIPGGDVHSAPHSARNPEERSTAYSGLPRSGIPIGAEPYQ